MNPLVEPGFVATKMQELRRALKFARVGTGEIGEAIRSCTFGIQARGFTMLIVTCRRSGRWQKAAEIFDTMTSLGVKPNFYAYAALISVCCNAKACTKALEVFHEMVAACKKDETLQPPDALTYRALILACHRDGRHQTVVSLYRAMHKEGANDDKQSMLCAMATFVILKQWGHALQVMDDLHALGVPIPLKEYLYFVTECANSSQCDVATEVLLMMQMAGAALNPQICHQVIRAAVSCSDIALALHMYNQMHENDIECALESYECLLQCLATSLRWSDFIRVLNRMRARGMALGSSASTAIIKCCIQAGETSLSHKLAMKLNCKKVLPGGAHAAALRNQSPRWTIKAMKGRRSGSPSPQPPLAEGRSKIMSGDQLWLGSSCTHALVQSQCMPPVMKKLKVFKMRDMMRDVPVISYR